MRYETLPALRCPAGCLSELEPVPDEETRDAILNGKLVCVGCGGEYPITDGIARLLPAHLNLPEFAPDNQDESDKCKRSKAPEHPNTEHRTPERLNTDAAAAELKRSEMAARDLQAEDYDKMRGLALFSKIEIPVTLAQMNLKPDDVLLEAGCGTGRMTPIFANRCASLVAVDFSFESLRRCQAKLKRAGITNVDLAQADVCALPFQSDAFSKLVSCQVLEHIPTPESRARMISELARVVETGGKIVLSAYQHSLFTRLFGQKEGQHDGGIYYYRFTRRELRDLLAPCLEVRGMTGALVYHYLARCEKTGNKTG